MRKTKLTNGQSARIASKMQDVRDIYTQYKWYLEMDNAAHSFMCKLGIHKEFYMLGGSAAMVAYGINIGRLPHDIDIIVADGIYDAVIQIIMDSPYYTRPSSDVPSSQHFAVEIEHEGRKFILDILPHPSPVAFKACKPGLVYLQDLMQIKQVKTTWIRAKDVTDRQLIAEFLDKCTPSKTEGAQ